MNTTSYCAAKHAVLGITKSVCDLSVLFLCYVHAYLRDTRLTGKLSQDAANYAKKNIRVNAVCPGYTDTPMIRMPGAGSSVGMDDYLKTCPMGRLGEAREVRNTCQRTN
jgi:hypothetical protein